MNFAALRTLEVGRHMDYSRTMAGVASICFGVKPDVAVMEPICYKFTFIDWLGALVATFQCVNLLRPVNIIDCQKSNDF